TATIKDDGTGTIWQPADPAVPNGPLVPVNPTDPVLPGVTPPVFDDDRTVSVNSIDVNEASGHGVFEVTGAAGQKLTLAVTDGTATGGADYGTTLEYFDGTQWTSYTAGQLVEIPAGGKLQVRVTIVNDTVAEGAEQFTLTATNTGGTAASGTATIKDDGTGTIWQPADPALPNGPLVPVNPTDPVLPGVTPPVFDDDRTVSVNSIDVNEASGHGVFEVSGAAGQKLTLALTDGTATGGADYGTTLEYFNGTQWTSYTAGQLVEIPAGGKLQVRVAIVNDRVTEGAEQFTLTATNTGGTGASGTATIKDDGTGTIWQPADPAVPNGPLVPVNPTDPVLPGVTPPVFDDDRTVSVNSIDVNEASGHGVFEVSGAAGQKLTLALIDGTARGGADYGTTLEYFDGTQWTSYTAGQLVEIPVGGKLQVRVAIVNDRVTEGDEQFTLTATNTGGTGASGTATIKDDGTGTIWQPTDPALPNGPLVPVNPTDPVLPGVTPPVFDDDRTVGVNSIDVNEASGHGVFEVTGAAGQKLTLALTDGTATGGGVDFGAALEYFDGTQWSSYTAGQLVEIPAGGKLQVRVAIVNDRVTEGAEQFTLTATNTGGTAASGTATIKDDGTGTIWQPVDPALPNGPLVPVNPTDPVLPGVTPPVFDDDRTVSVNSIDVNEASSHAVFAVQGAQGQKLTLQLVDGTATGGGTDFGSTDSHNLQYSLDGGATWADYNGISVQITGADGKLLVRTPIVNDALTEIIEDFALQVQVVGGQASATGNATINDDGQGSIWVPTDPRDPYSPLVTNPEAGQVGHVPPDIDNRSPEVPPSLSVTTPEDTSVSGLVPAIDPDGDTLEYSLTTPPSHGTVVLTPGTNAYTYTPDANYHGADTFEVTVDDGRGGKVTATITVQVTPVNDVPVAPDQSETTPEDTPLSGRVVGSDVDGDALTYSKGSDPGNGSVVVRADGSYTYTPNQDFNGTDRFEVTVDDGQGGRTTATVTVMVTPVNDAPQADPLAVKTNDGTPVGGKVTGSDVDGDALSFGAGPKGPDHGTVTIAPDGSFIYVPRPGYHGPDAFEVTVDDGQGAKATTTVTVDVNARPALPPAQMTADEGVPVAGQLAGSDADGDPLGYAVAQAPAKGSVILNEQTGEFVYVPAQGASGTDSFVVSVDDGRGGTTTAVVTVDIRPPVNSSQPGATPPQDGSRPDAASPGANLGAGSNDVSGMPGVFFYWDDFNRVARMDAPLHPAVFVAPAVATSQAEQADREVLGNDPGITHAGEMQASSIGAGLLTNPANVIYVGRAVQDSQQMGEFWNRLVQNLLGKSPADMQGVRADATTRPGMPASLDAVDAPMALLGASPAEAETPAQTLADANQRLLEIAALGEAQRGKEAQGEHQRLPSNGSFRQQLNARAHQLPGRKVTG
ncbi:Ig-like domain-containing protein, partial [Comamonas antarctica]|uniref:Ig-like domain-containing protein n=1 Tax=Comamonas antarctica TaxID=2743470 RepID=UPI0028E4365A